LPNQPSIGSCFGLDTHGIEERAGDTYWNLPTPRLVEASVHRQEATLAVGGALCTSTAPFTGRSPNDKFVVRDAETEERVWWGKVNQPISEEAYDRLRRKVVAYLGSSDRFVADLHLGADPRYRVPLRIISQHAWATLFARNMFIRPPLEELSSHAPEFTVQHAPSVDESPGV
jgi:phosphoenolpyruvate carboxykinase (ATP)